MMSDEPKEFEAGTSEIDADSDAFDVLKWEEVEPSAVRLFRFCHDSSHELEWAKKSWEVLTEAGLTRWTNEVERLKVEFRLLALAAICHGFFEAIGGFVSELTHTDLLEAIEPDPFTIGRLCEREVFPGFDDDLSETDYAFYLIEARRDEVLDSLLARHEGWLGLFHSLTESYAGWDNLTTGERLRVRSWVVDQGCSV